jgi:hypothetical protein
MRLVSNVTSALPGINLTGTTIAAHVNGAMQRMYVETVPGTENSVTLAHTLLIQLYASTKMSCKFISWSPLSTIAVNAIVVAQQSLKPSVLLPFHAVMIIDVRPMG